MLVRVARIGKPFGVAGRVTVQVFTDEPADRFLPGAGLSAGEQNLVIDYAHRHGSRWVLGFDGVADRDAAESLRGTELYADVPEGTVPADPEEWYDRDLVGLVCRDSAGKPLGEVVAVEHPPPHDVLLVRTTQGHVARVPFVSQIVTSVASDGIVLVPPAGLLDPELEP